MSSQAQLSDAFTDLSSIDAGQARECARALLRTPLIRPDGPDGHLLPMMYRHRDVLGALFSSYLGYPLTIERRFARLHKRLDSTARRGITGFTPRAYVYLALTLAALAGAGRQILLSQLVADIRGAAAEAGITVSDDRVELRALSSALRHLVSLGVLEETDGTVTAVGQGQPGEALITISLDLLGLVMARAVLTVMPGPDGLPTTGLATGLEVGLLARRRLAEDPAVLFRDLPEPEAAYLRARQLDESYWLDRYFGLQVEARSEGIATVDPDGYLTDLPFPAESTVSRMALLALPPLLEAAAPATEDRYLVTADQVQGICRSLHERYPKAWATAETSNMERLASKVADLLTQVGLARRASNGGLLLSSAARRWQPLAREKKPTPESPAHPGGGLTLFDDEDGGEAP
jgi:uncharacterized protein (TIGR02678 family)